MRKFFSFDKMITPFIIKFFFWLGILGVLISGFIMIGVGIFSKEGGFMQIITGIISLFLGPILVRIYCEMLIVFFKMQESLVQIRDFLFEQKELKRSTLHQTNHQSDEGKLPI